MTGENTKLSSSMTVARFRILEASADKGALSQFIVERFNERFFRPIEDTPSKSKHGFTSMAIACLVIETLESFYQGLPDTKGGSRKMFHDFFARDGTLQIFSSDNDWFYYDIRCGILHQGEAREGWRILRTGPILDETNKTINATAMLRALKEAVHKYSMQLLLLTDEKYWVNFQKKMKAVCENCD